MRLASTSREESAEQRYYSACGLCSLTMGIEPRERLRDDSGQPSTFLRRFLRRADDNVARGGNPVSQEGLLEEWWCKRAERDR